MPTTTSIGELMTERLETIYSFSSAQEASRKMEELNISSLLVIDSNDNNKPIGIITERDLVREVCVNGISSSDILTKNVMSSPLITIDARSPIGEAADVMIQNKIRHLLVVENNNNNNNNINKPIGIISPTDFIGYLKENLEIGNNEVNAKILESLRAGRQKEEYTIIEELEQQGKLQKDSAKGGQEYENEEPRQG
jgi:CBS domain-containing protein